MTALELALVELVADQAIRQAAFEQLAQRWLRELAQARAANEALRGEIQRYVRASGD